jgi:uncharacterized membrane protein YoaT (DUF817 family)
MSIHRYLYDFFVFGLKQAYAALYGGAMLLAILVTAFWWPENAALTRYDFLFLYAIGVQVTF